MFIFFYKWKTAYGMRIGDWSSDACASDLAVKSVLAERGRIDGLVNNAGGQYPMPLAAISKKGWDAVVASNLTGGFLMARETYTQWMQKNGGAIVNMIADMWGGMPGMGHSGAARAGMLNFTETAAIEWGASDRKSTRLTPVTNAQLVCR